MIKRLFDITVSLIGLFLLSPILIVISAVIKIADEGPILYKGIRTGQFGHPFKILKFRTMVSEAECLGGTTTAQNDPRITLAGKVLRKYKLDELPQLVNVLFGDMSLVGPRPEVPEYTSLYTQEEKQILSVKPGITDFSSIHFHDLQSYVGSEDADFVFKHSILATKNQYRLKYVRERSFMVDIKILFTTLGIIFLKPFNKTKTND